MPAQRIGLFLVLVAVISLQEFLAAAAIENAAYSPGDLVNEEAGQSWSQKTAPAVKRMHKRYRRHHGGYSGERNHHGHHHKHHHGCHHDDYDFEEQSHGHWPHHGFPQGPSHHGFGPNIPQGPHDRPYKTPLAPFEDHKAGPQPGPVTPKPVKPSSEIPIANPTPAASTTTTTTTADPTLDIDIRLGS